MDHGFSSYVCYAVIWSCCFLGHRLLSGVSCFTAVILKPSDQPLADPGLAKRDGGQGRAPPKNFSGEGLSPPQKMFWFGISNCRILVIWAPFLQFSYLLYTQKNTAFGRQLGAFPLDPPLRLTLSQSAQRRSVKL